MTAGPSRFRRAILTLGALLLLASGRAWAATHVRLVDSERKVPLEFWVKDVNLPWGGAMHCRMVQKVYVDGRVVPFAQYGQEEKGGLLGGEEKKDETGGIGEEIETDLGGGAPKDVQFKSDRMLEVINALGVKALITRNFEAGEHVLQPGGQRFTTDEQGTVAKGDGSLVRTGAESLLLLCRAVDLNLLPIPQKAQNVTVRVSSGGLVVFEEAFDVRQPQVLRIYLPVSAEPYAVAAGDRGSLRLQVGKDGVSVVGQAEPGENVRVFTAGFAAALAPRQLALADAKAARVQKPEVYLFTDRSREVYLEGERVQISVRAFGPDPAPQQAALTLQDGERAVDLGTVALAQAGGELSAEIELDTALLRPGAYRVQAQWAGAASNALPLQVAGAMRATSVRLFTHLKWGPYSMEPADMDRLADLGLNLLSEGLADTQGQTAHGEGQTPLEAWGRRRGDPAAEGPAPGGGPNAPPELSEPKLPHSCATERMLLRGVDFLPMMFSARWMILYFNVGEAWRDQAEDRYQSVQHMGQDLRRFPNFLGLNYATGDGPTPATMGHVFATAGVANFDVIHGQRLTKLRELFEAKYGQIQVDTSGQDKKEELTDKERKEQAQHGLAWGFRVGDDIRMNVAGPDSKKVLWCQWVNDLYPEQFRNCRRALEVMMPGPVMTCGSTWGPGAGGGMYPGTFYRPLDNPLNDFHGDYGVCNFNYITGSDILTMGMEGRGRRPWVGLDLIDTRTPASGIKLLLETLSRNPAGIGVLNLHQDFICPWAGRKVKSEDLRLLMRIAAQLGDTFMNLERADEVAVVSSFRQEALDGQPFRALWAAHYVAQKAGYQANVVTDAFCETGPQELARQFRAVFLFGMASPASPEFMQAMRAFQQQGGLIIADQACKLDLPGAVALPFAVPDSRGPSNMNDHLEFERFFAPYIEKFRATVGPRLKPFFAMPASRFTGIRSRDGDVSYLTVFNDGKPDIEDGVHAQFLCEGARATVSIAASGALYDVLRQERVQTAPADGGLRFNLDMTHYPGSVFVLAPAAIKALEVSCTPRCAPGELVTLRAAAIMEDGAALKGRLPVEFSVADPRGQARYRVCRTSNVEVRLKVAGNDPAGQWRWTAKDLATGLVAEGAFTVAGPQARPSQRALDEVVFDAASVHQFLRSREAQVVIFPEQLALLEAAEQLVKGLKERGVRATLRMVWPSETSAYPMQWSYETIEDCDVREGVLGGRLVGRRVRGKNQMGTKKEDSFKGSTAFYGNYVASAEAVYYGDVILLDCGGAPSNPMLEVIHRGRMLQRNVSPSFPARGSGFVAYAWGPFHYGHDAVLVCGRDAAGLRKAAASLLRLAERKEPPARDFLPVTARQGAENGQFYAQLGLKAAGEAARAASAERRPEPAFPAVYPRSATGAAADDKGRICIAQQPLGEKGGPNLAVIDTASGRARQLSLAGNADASALARYLREQDAAGPKALWPAAGCFKLAGDYLARADRGVGLCAPEAAWKWFYEPFPVFRTYQEAKYPRTCQNWAMSADGAWLLASFYDLTPGGDSDTMTLNRPDVALLDARTGRPALVIEGYVGSHMALSSDASRIVIVDEWAPKKREHANPQGGPVLAVWDRAGKELYHVGIVPPVDAFRVSANGALAAVSFNDPRKQVLIVDVEARRAAYHAYSSIDVGLEVAPDGAFAVVCYSDGAVHKLGRDGRPLFEARLPGAGLPVVMPATGEVRVVCHDGFVYALDSEGKVTARAAFGDAPAEELRPARDAVPAGVEPPEPTPFWQALPRQMVKALPSPLPDGKAEFKGEKTIVLDVPKLSRWDVALLHFRYRLQDAGDELTVGVPSEDAGRVTLRFPHHALPCRASVPLRMSKAGKVELALRAQGGVAMDDAGLAVIDLSGMANAALTSRPGAEVAGGLDNVPQVLVPNVIGLLGDPRCEQVAYGLTADGGRGWEKVELPPEFRGAKTDRYSYFDGKAHSGTPLYPAAERRGDLRSAQVMLEFQKPHKVSAVGVWEAPGQLPVSAFTLECCDKYEIDEQTKVPKADWRLVCVGRHNGQYFHLHTFAPVQAKVWRYTVLQTAAPMQLCAEIELYQETMETLMDLQGGLEDGGF